MSQSHVQVGWTRAQVKLARLLGADVAASKGFSSERQAQDHVRRLFVQYNDLLKKFDDIHASMVHPQKRAILRLLLDGLVGRLVELKQEMIKFDGCEYTYFEDLALDQNKTLVHAGRECLSSPLCAVRTGRSVRAYPALLC